MKQLKRPLACAGYTALAVMGTACAGGNSPQSSGEPVGSLHLALNVEGLTIDRVDLAITSEDLDPVVERNRTINVSDPNATVSATEAGLPGGSYTVALSAQVEDDPTTPEDEGEIPCAGEVDGVVVEPGLITEVDDLVLLCSRDGGDLSTAGGLTIRADVEYEEANTCGDLAQELSIAPLETSVGQSVDLRVVAEPDVSVQWEASAGTFAADNGSYTCPDVAGTYLLEVTLTRPDGCSETFEQGIGCHSTYEGECGTLPEKFAFEGTCGLRSPCHLEQDGCDWQATCRGRTMEGEGEADGFPFYSTGGELCTATLQDGELVGSCTGEDGEVCDFSTDSDPDPVPYCAQLPETITGVTACGRSWDSCDVIQDGCDYQVRCDDGAVILGGGVDGDVLEWDFTTPEGESMRCQGPIVDGSVAGACEQRGRGLENPRTCEDFSATVPQVDAACDETLPGEGFVVEGCGLDSTCFAVQRGCVWEVNCAGQVYGGIASETNRFEFTDVAGRDCTASVVDGELQGSCTGATDSCELETVEPSVDPSCLQLPETVTVRGCGFSSQTAFPVVQDGCSFQASGNGGQAAIAGTALEAGITFPGLNPEWTCELELNDDGTELWGGCTRENPDGTVSQCRDFTDTQAARLVIGL